MNIKLTIDNIQPRFPETISKYYKKTQNSVTDHLAKAIRDAGIDLTIIPVSRNLAEELKFSKPDLVLNRSHLTYALEDEAYAPKILEQYKIPYTGPNSKNCVTAFDKFLSKQVFERIGIATPNFILFRNQNEFRVPENFTYPLFIKPIQGGSSLGISEENLVFDKKSCEAICQRLFDEINQPLLIEEFLPGREFTVGILGNHRPLILPIIEFDMQGSRKYSFRSFTSKMIEGKKEIKTCPAILSTQLENEIRNTALLAYKAMGCRDYARIDIRLDKTDIPNVLEVNAFPILIPGGSSYVHMAGRYGLSFSTLISEIIEIVLRRCMMPYNEKSLRNPLEFLQLDSSRFANEAVNNQ